MSANISNNLFRQGLAQIYSTQTYPTIQVLEVGRSPHLAEPGAARALDGSLESGRPRTKILPHVCTLSWVLSALCCAICCPLSVHSALSSSTAFRAEPKSTLRPSTVYGGRVK